MGKSNLSGYMDMWRCKHCNELRPSNFSWCCGCGKHWRQCAQQSWKGPGQQGGRKGQGCSSVVQTGKGSSGLPITGLTEFIECGWKLLGEDDFKAIGEVYRHSLDAKFAEQAPVLQVSTIENNIKKKQAQLEAVDKNSEALLESIKEMQLYQLNDLKKAMQGIEAINDYTNHDSHMGTCQMEMAFACAKSCIFFLL